jgi:hypothetical protein
VSNVKINGHARSIRNLVNLKLIRTITLEDRVSARGQHHICLHVKKNIKKQHPSSLKKQTYLKTTRTVTEINF